ncbi:MAG: PH domain-containing protein [Microbacterium sp.]
MSQDGAAPDAATRSPLSDGQWHRLHPLTPVLRGGLFLVLVIGIVVANLRDRVIGWLLPAMTGGPGPGWDEYEEDPVDFIVANGLVIVALIAVVVVLAALVAWFSVSWRFHTFRITDDDVEVRSGILFRTQRRAPLDRVQGVNLTRPMVARLLGAAKLEVVGAGSDANVALEYLSTANAEAVRADILRLASGRQLARAAATAGGAGRTHAAVAAVGAGFMGLIEGAEHPVAEAESVVRIPTGRLVAARLLSGPTLLLVFLIGVVVVGSLLGAPWVLFSIIPMLIGFGALWLRQITRSLRYSIAPTPSGVRITFGLFTTITEILPPGRAHAFEVRQPLLWRGFGWWSLRVNRLSGGSGDVAQVQAEAEVLPIGTRDDVERVLRLFLPDITGEHWREVIEQGLIGRGAAADPYTTTPRRARWLRPLSWRRNGFLLTADALLLRRGLLRRDLAILPLARLQSVKLRQGPLARALRVAAVAGHTVLGPVSGGLGAIDRDAAYDVWQAVARDAVRAGAADRSHRWDEGGPASAGPDAVACEAGEVTP